MINNVGNLLNYPIFRQIDLTLFEFGYVLVGAVANGDFARGLARASSQPVESNFSNVESLSLNSHAKNSVPISIGRKIVLSRQGEIVTFFVKEKSKSYFDNTLFEVRLNKRHE